ncbi:MAG: HD domain-containing protein [Acidobacteriota bacterium]|nr:HD domain-containing protein [Acidobacteriota bacterium]
MAIKNIQSISLEIIRTIIDNTKESIYLASSEGFEYVNPAFEKLTGYKKEEIYARNFNFLRLVHPDDRHLFSAAKGSFPKPNILAGTELLEFRLMNLKGELKYVEASTSRLEENPCLTLVILRDITSRKKTEIELKETLDKLRKTMGATIQAISLTIESRDPYTAGHQRRVSDLARSITTRLAYPTEEIDEIRLAAQVHDLGKISVPAEILNKPGALNPDEFEMIKDHPRVGYEILKTIEFPWPVAQIVHQHHERLDGSGYPLGLKDGQIHPMAKILAVADVVEAMLSHRPYRPAFSPETVIQEITANAGKLYDQAAVKACTDIIQQKFKLSNVSFD